LDRAQVMASTHAATMASIDVELTTSDEHSVEDVAREERLATSVERPSRSSAARRAAVTPATDSGAWHESAQLDATPGRRRRMFISAGIVSAVVVVVLVLVASFGGDGSTQANTPEVGSPPTVPQTETIAVVPEETETETATEPETSHPAELEPAEADRDEAPATASDAEGEGPEVEEETASRERETPRAMRMRASEGATSDDTPAMTSNAGTPAMMRGHRAGDLSLEDF
jgi:hypothetical protein